MTPESPEARARVDELRGRFTVLTAPARGAARGLSGQAATTRVAVLGESVATGFVTREGSVYALIPDEARRAETRTASVALPTRARDPVLLADDASHVTVSFALLGASDATILTAAGIAMYPGALAGADVLHRVHAAGTEDYVVFDRRPAREEIAYDVDVSRVAGLRLVGDALELLDGDGTPALRVATPYVVDGHGARRDARLALEGCAFDASPRAPWGRAVVPPGASRCTVRVTWEADAYPALVDPSWTATGSMKTTRQHHGMALLGSGKVLVAGGMGTLGLHASAELYDPASGTFASTGSMATMRLVFTTTALGSGEVLVAGGATDTDWDATAAAEVYDPQAGTFTATAHPMTSARRIHTATLLPSGQVLIAGGFASSDTTDTGSAGSSAELYDPATDTFVAVEAALVAARAGHVAARLPSGKVLLASGTDGAEILTSAEIYDLEAKTFTATGSMTTAHIPMTAAVVLASGKVLLPGGWVGMADLSTGTGSTAAEIYDEATGTFTATGALASGRYWHSATLLESGDVLVAGGFASTAGPTLGDAELYDPDAGTFGSGGTLMEARGGHRAVLLGSGDVLVTGGSTLAVYLASAERYGTPPGDAGADGSTEPSDAGSDGGASTPGSSGGCGCRVADRPPAPASALIAVVAAALLGRARRRPRITPEDGR
jgi:MYXO-CTERM domain-containing protein